MEGLINDAHARSPTCCQPFSICHSLKFTPYLRSTIAKSDMSTFRLKTAHFFPSKKTPQKCKKLRRNTNLRFARKNNPRTISKWIFLRCFRLRAFDKRTNRVQWQLHGDCPFPRLTEYKININEQAARCVGASRRSPPTLATLRIRAREISHRFRSK